MAIYILITKRLLSLLVIENLGTFLMKNKTDARCLRAYGVEFYLHTYFFKGFLRPSITKCVA
ncbi:MAG: hypothetical protein ACI30A_02110 [Paludibacteraceae bacterium]